MATVTINFQKVAGYRNIGSFWRSNAAYRAIRSHLQKMAHDGFFKLAAIGGATEEGFEQAFSSLAYAYLKDKAPRLLDFMVGFQLVERNEDNTKAMGIFGFQVGEQWLYAPVFFLNGDLKGHELLYIKNQDSFVPMKENWVNYLMSRKPHVLGEGSQDDTFRLGGLMPGLDSITNSPASGLGKRGSDGAAHFDDWVKPALPLIAAMRQKYAKALYGSAKAGSKLAFDQVVAAPKQAALAELAGKFDLNKVLPNSPQLLKTAFEIAQRFPTIKRGFDRFYGRDCFTRWGMAVKGQELRRMSNILPAEKRAAAPKPRYTGNSLIPETVLPEHPIKTGALRMYVYETVAITHNLPELDEDEREKLLNDTVLIKDERGDKDISKAYNTQVEQKLANPHETGLYEVLEKPGSFARMLVISNPIANDGQKDFCTVVRIGDGKKKSWLNAHRSNLWADKVELKEDYDKWFEGLGDKTSLQKGGTYIAIGPNGQGTVPFEVRETYEDGAYKVDFKSYCDYSYRRSPDLPRFGGQTESGCCGGDYISTWNAKLYIDPEGRRGTKLRAIQGELRVPGNFKIMKIKDPPPPPKKDKDGFLMAPSVIEDSGSEEKPIQPGKLEDLQALFTEKTAAMKLYDDHNEVVISTAWAGDQRLPRRSALLSLIGHHGLSEKTARAMLKQAAYKGGARFRVRYAPGFGSLRHMTKTAYGPTESILAGGPGAPPMMPPEFGIEMMGGRNAVRSQYPDEQFNQVPELDSSMGDPNAHDPWQNYTFEDFQSTMGQAQQAAQEGQKEVFDTAMISGMLKSVRQDTLVDRYLGDLLKALDKLGRILFMFYWHQEEFEDRYGKQDLPELEDSLRNAFETLGDVTLFLKEKTIEPGFGMGNREAEPEIEEAARN